MALIKAHLGDFVGDCQPSLAHLLDGFHCHARRPLKSQQPVACGLNHGKLCNDQITRRCAVSGSRQRSTSFDSPLATRCMATTTLAAPLTRSIAPPMPGTIFPGTFQFPKWPSSSTCRPPRTVRSSWPPLLFLVTAHACFPVTCLMRFAPPASPARALPLQSPIPHWSE